MSEHCEAGVVVGGRSGGVCVVVAGGFGVGWGDVRWGDVRWVAAVDMVVVGDARWV